MSGSSSSMRRKPRRTSWWSSTRRTEILGFDTRLLRRQRHREPNQCAASLPIQKLQPAMHQIGPLTHGNQAHAVGLSDVPEPHAMVFHFEHDRIGLVSQANRGVSRFRMPRQIVQRLLQNAEQVNGYLLIDRCRCAQCLVSDFDSRLLLEYGKM